MLVGVLRCWQGSWVMGVLIVWWQECWGAGGAAEVCRG